MEAALRPRNEIELQYCWNTSSIYANEELWEQDFRAVAVRLPELAALQGTLAHSGAAFLAVLRLRDDINRTIERLLVYAVFRRDEDLSQADQQARFDRIVALQSQSNAAAAFVTPEILALGDTTLNGFIQQTPDLAPYHYLVSELWRRRAHMRSAEVEEVLAQAGELMQVPDTIFSALTNADMVFGTVRDAEGNEIELSHGRLWALLERPERDIRRTALEQYSAAYLAHQTTIAATLNGALRANIFQARARGYPSALEAALDTDAIPPMVYHSLIDAVHQYLPSVHHYLELRKRLLGLDTLHFYDFLVPLSQVPPPSISYDDARELVLAALAPLGPEYTAALRRGLYEERWVDVHETPHKRSGAYSWSAYGTQPFILLNWQNTLSDVLVLAHEAGHAMHSYLANQAQPYCTSTYTIFVAEVASTCNEALLFAHLLRTITDPDQLRGLLSLQINSIAATLIEQTMFAEFEREVYRRVEQGEALGAAHFAELAGQLRAQYGGPAVTVDAADSSFWGAVPHFYWNFYVYKYATGISAGLALAQRILEEGEPAVARYMHFLRSGGSQQSIQLLKDAGVDLTTTAPVEQAMQVFSALVERLEALTNAAPAP